MIASYQIHNVLKLYTDRLSKKRRLKDLRGDDDAVLQPEATRPSNNGRRDYLVERLAADIVSRIQNRGPQESCLRNSPEAASEPKEEPSAAVGEFVYNIISDDQCKKTVRLSLGDSDFLVRRIEEMARNRSRNRKAFG